ncbi:ATP synthase subunit C lysine N-methyltransferase [Megalopta genalis]|uniref:ATP synthase subunit C lysine N-methyltransferase n=1 Tax=Megalopta genalis TaxID=115081 RepID=UPI001442FD9A|nr:ATP synthase subunit C lysine N-methyltransferase [Megalopta genalis]XP_033324865.1 ATP synthase subunit C lysine N-methyltransferase [Megalopta genalis]
MSEVNDLNYILSKSENIGKPYKPSKLGWCLVGITGGIATAISVVCIPFVSPAFRKICLPYVPATTQQVQNVLVALEKRSGSLIDLGSGDGRIVFAAAKAGFKAHGIELNPWLVWYSRLKALFTGFSSQTKFIRQNLWTYNLNNYNNIILFGVGQMMQEIEDKFLMELQEDCTIVACRFPLPNMCAIKVIGEGVDTVWVYKVPKKS